MTGRIFHLSDKGEATPMEERPYDAERTLQELLANHPDLLAGEQIDSEEPRRWLFITREMSVPGEEGGARRWALDHLFLDQDGVPTLVEVKRSSNTQIRREVVGQMLDYAANAVVYWPVEKIIAAFESRCDAKGTDADEELAQFLGQDHDPNDYWEQVKTNLQAGRVRMVFIADEIPPELRRVVEFLNGQMDPAEVIAIEIRQYVGQGMKTLVPRVIGVRKPPPTSSRRQWDESSFFSALRERHGSDAASVAERILDWAKSNSLRIWWGKGGKEGSFFPMLCWKGNKNSTVAVWTYGRVEIQFQWLKNRQPFADEDKRLELRRRLNQIPGVDIPAEAISLRPSILLSTLADKAALEQFLGVLNWMIEEMKAT